MEAVLQAANRAADAAAVETLAAFRTPLSVVNKKSGGDFDPVTIADESAERAIRRVLEEAFPDIGFLGEETSETAVTEPVHWVVDPIDGTRAFISGMPLWGTLIALNERGDQVFGMIDQPVLQERFVGFGGQSHLFKSGEKLKLQTSSCTELATAIVQTTSPEMFGVSDELEKFNRLARAAKMVRYGGDCYSYAMLASGFIDLVIEADLQPYDVQALIPVVEGAGGVISNWAGESAASGGTMLAAASRELHTAALKLLQS